jgi:cytochrome subunit of sulfide dehydrogenase
MITCRIPIATSFALAFTSIAAAGPADIPAGAAACSGCHPTKQFVATQVPRLTGRNAAQIVAAMAEFRSGARPATVMDRIVKGFTDDEISAIAAWYAAQKD